MTIESTPHPFAALASAILPDHPEYDAARISFNRILDRRPAAIVPCATTDDVVAAVRAARSETPGSGD